jgi:hypothetical protein
MKGPLTNEQTPQPERQGAARSSARTEQGKPSIKTDPARFDTLVARYYSSIYSFVLRITDDFLEAVLLTHHAFNSTRKQLQGRRDEAVIVIMLVAAVIQGLNARGFN